jgi:hypothetical protein
MAWVPMEPPRAPEPPPRPRARRQVALMAKARVQSLLARRAIDQALELDGEPDQGAGGSAD